MSNAILYGKFNEATRVQMPAMMHLARLGYQYLGKITEEMAGTVYCFHVNYKQDYNFALFTLCGKNMFDDAIKVSKGTKMPVVSAEDNLFYKVSYSKEISRLFNAFFIQKTICNNVKEICELTNLRDWLLPMLMNGQATVED